MCAELQSIEADARHPIINEPRILPGCEPARRIPAAELNLLWLSARHFRILVNRRPGLIREYKSHGPACLFLADGRAVKGVSTRREVLNTDRNDVGSRG
jgi:hypothetical protein